MDTSRRMMLSRGIHRRPRGTRRHISSVVASAAVFVAFFASGMLVFWLLQHVILPENCLLLREFLQNPSAEPTLKGRLLATVLREKIFAVLLALGFLTAFSYLADFAASLLLGYRALLLGIALGAADLLFRTGQLTAPLFTLFIMKEALLTALLIGYLTLSAALSHRMRDLGRRQIGLACLLSLSHFLRLLLFLATALLISFSLSIFIG